MVELVKRPKQSLSIQDASYRANFTTLPSPDYSSDLAKESHSAISQWREKDLENGILRWKMSVHKRGFIFLTFLGSCVSIVLLAAAFGTKYWTVAHAKNTHNLSKSSGKINIGLFEGEKSLNIGYGLRTYPIHVIDMAQNEPNILVYKLWLSTVAGLSLSLLFAVISAIFSVINTATTPISTLTGIPGLYLWNTLAVLCEFISIGVWTYQYYTKLQKNMLTPGDRKLAWTSEGMAHLSYSFWFVIISAALQILNVIIICYATGNRTNASSIIEEKGNGAIMLY